MGNPLRLTVAGDELRTERHRSSAADVERVRAELESLRAEDRWVRRVGVVVCVVVLLFALLRLTGVGPALGGGNVG